MNDLTPPAAATRGDDLASLRTLTLVIYVLYALSAFVGLTAIVAIIVNYIKRDDARGTLYESHFRWQIRTFWFGLLWACLGALTIFIFGIGFVVLAVNSIWLIYRVVRGFLNWNDGKPMPMPA
jgi:uncharacterized membrane protein